LACPPSVNEGIPGDPFALLKKSRASKQHASFRVRIGKGMAHVEPLAFALDETQSGFIVLLNWQRARVRVPCKRMFRVPICVTRHFTGRTVGEPSVLISARVSADGYPITWGCQAMNLIDYDNVFALSVFEKSKTDCSKAQNEDLNIRGRHEPNCGKQTVASVRFVRGGLCKLSSATN
jgi:hypothetical protein